MAKDTWHRLSDVDEAAQTAFCSVCGQTRIRLRSGRRGHECWARRQAERKRRRVLTRNGRRTYDLRRRYGIDQDDYDRLVQKQAGCCAICLNSAEVLNIDHDHFTGKVRGLLCRRCNQALGLLGDDIAGITAALCYLLASS